LVDQAGDQFQQPGVGAFVQRADAELLDQHHIVVPRVIGQHADRVMAHKQFAAELRAHAAGELAMAQVQTVQAVEALEAGLALEHLDIGMWHAIPPCGRFYARNSIVAARGSVLNVRVLPASWQGVLLWCCRCSVSCAAALARLAGSIPALPLMARSMRVCWLLAHMSGLGGWGACGDNGHAPGTPGTLYSRSARRHCEESPCVPLLLPVCCHCCWAGARVSRRAACRSRRWRPRGMPGSIALPVAKSASARWSILTCSASTICPNSMRASSASCSG